jgi:hypothetical protein
MHGMMSGTFSSLIWRGDGVNIAVSFNQSNDPSGTDYGEVSTVLNRVADGIKQYP